MTRMPSRFQSLAALIVAVLASPLARADGEVRGWKPEQAAKYLDEREKVWFAFSSAKRGEGATQSTCVSCHSVLPYALARPVLHKLNGAKTSPDSYKHLLTQTRKRVENWKKLDTPAFGLLYDFDERKKKESWGTESVLNAVLLAFDDRSQGRASPSEETKQAFVNLWQTQVQTGDHKGSWDWLDFNMGPWEWQEARYFGTTLAAIAVGTAPGSDAVRKVHVDLLRRYLKGGFARQNLHNRAWLLWAAVKVDGILTKSEQKTVIDQLLAQQQTDGGWSLPTLGKWVRSDGTSQETASDGYATGLLLHVLQTAGLPKDDAKIAKGLAWLEDNQASTGAWPGFSVNKKRNLTTHAGKFMSDAATAFAVLALSH